MMNKLQEIDEFSTAPLSMTLHPDWDISNVLHKELKWFSQKPTIDCIRNHQDGNPNE